MAEYSPHNDAAKTDANFCAGFVSFLPQEDWARPEYLKSLKRRVMGDDKQLVTVWWDVGSMFMVSMFDERRAVTQYGVNRL